MKKKNNSTRNNFCTLYIGNLNPKTREDKIYTLFQQFGKINSCQIIKDEEGNSKNHGFITFYNKENAEEAKKKLNLYKIDNNEIRIDFKKENPVSEKKANIFLKNIGTESLKELEEYMKNFGNVLSCEIRKNFKGESLKYGYVQFKNPEEAKLAVEKLNGQKKWGLILEAKIFIDQKDRINFINNLFVKNFPKLWSKMEIEFFLESEFGKYGKIVSKYLLENKFKKNEFFGYVSYQTREECIKAIKNLNERMFLGKYTKEDLDSEKKKFKKEKGLIVNFCLTKNQRNLEKTENENKPKSLYLKGLLPHVSEAELKSVFSFYGKILSMNLKNAKLKAEHGGFYKYCYVNLDNHETAKEIFENRCKNSKILRMFSQKCINDKNFLEYLNVNKKKKKTFNNKKNHLLSNPFGINKQEKINSISSNSYNKSDFNFFENFFNMNINKKKDLNWLKNNKEEFFQKLKKEQREILGELMIKRISNVKNLGQRYKGKITNILIDLEILEYEEIIDILQNNKSLYQRIDEAIEIIKEND